MIHNEFKFNNKPENHACKHVGTEVYWSISPIQSCLVIEPKLYGGNGLMKISANRAKTFW